jgi:signal recognition particle subunit SRP54
MVIKIVQDELTRTLGSEVQELNLSVTPPMVMMMVGLQGSGKTTSSGKLAHWIKNSKNKKILLASLDVYRPAAQAQLEVLANQINVGSLPIVEGEKPEKITKRALTVAKKEGYDLLILDTAGRLQIDDELMEELVKVKALAKPHETLLVADSLTGQEAVHVADRFHQQIGVTGIILTRLDGDGRGGAALSMKQATGCPIVFAGMGEKIDEFEPFYPDRIAQRILGMGDVASLVEKASQLLETEDNKAMEKRLKRGKFDFNDLLSQLATMKKMGGVGSILGMMPGMGSLKGKLDASQVDDSKFARLEAIVLSMTPKERRNPELIKGSRKRRLALGSGTDVQEINRLLKMQKQMQGVLKKFKGMDKKSMMRSGMGKMFGM